MFCFHDSIWDEFNVTYFFWHWVSKRKKKKKVIVITITKLQQSDWIGPLLTVSWNRKKMIYGEAQH